MAITVKHNKVSTIPDDADTSLVRPSDWNDDHVLTGTVPITNGGTGAATANDAFNALAPSQTGNTGKYLTTDGTNSSWSTNPLGTVTSVAATAGTGISVTGSPITTSGTLNITNTAPDQTVVLTAGTGISTSGTYPNFTITNTSPSLGGDVVGPASATDNAIARFDGTTGKLLQNSVVAVSDTGAVTGVTTLAASTSVTTPIVQASNSAGLALRNSAGTSQISMGAGGGDNVTIAVSTNLNGTNAQIDISPTGTGHVHLKPTGTGAVEIAPTNAGTMNNMVIGGTTPLAITGTTITGTSFVGSGASLTNVVNSLAASTGISVSGATGAVTVTNTAPDQTVSIASGTGISATGTYPAFTVTNTAPDQTVALANGTGISVTGTYPNFTITNTSPSSGGTVTSVTGTSPVVSSGGNTPAISMPAATTSVNGYLTSTDWTTFNSKGSGSVTSVSGTGTVNGITLTGTVTSSGNLTLGGTLSNVSLATQVTGNLPVTNLGSGTGASASTFWRGDGSWASVTATTATNLAGGALGSVPYQLLSGTTVFLAGNTTTTPQFLTSTGVAGVATAPTYTGSTGSGNVVLATSPTLITPALGTPASGVVTNLTGTASININGTVGATTANTGAFTTLGATGVATFSAGTVSLPAITTTGDTNTGIYFPAADTIAFTEGGAESMRIDSSGNLKFNSGYGSVATAYGCRAWVNFNGTGTVAIRASGNVSSITDNGTGNYTVNFTTAMPDANYAAVVSNQSENFSFPVKNSALGTVSTSSIGVYTGSGETVLQDHPVVCVSVFR